MFVVKFIILFVIFCANSELQFLMSFSCMNNMCLFYLWYFLYLLFVVWFVYNHVASQVTQWRYRTRTCPFQPWS